MLASFSFINGVSFGIEYVEANPLADIPCSCVIVDFLFFRWIFEISSGEQK
jgi:hypothetical protein